MVNYEKGLMMGNILKNTAEKIFRNKTMSLCGFLLCVLLLSRMVGMVVTYRTLDSMEKSNLFFASMMAHGVSPSLSLFRINAAHAGGGSWFFSLLTVPFIWIFGQTYLSLRLTGLVFLAGTYIWGCCLCKRYFGAVTAVVFAVLFLCVSEHVFYLSILGDGRHFHYNFFFLALLYFLLQTRQHKRSSGYVWLGIVSGAGVFFYPAFLVTVVICMLTLLCDIRTRGRMVFAGLTAIICSVMLASMFLTENGAWYTNIYSVLCHSPKTVLLRGNIGDVMHRLWVIWADTLPFMLTQYIGTFASSTLWTNIPAPQGIMIYCFRIFFLGMLAFFATYILWCVLRNRRHSTHTMQWSIINYVIAFLMMHLVIYCSIFAFNDAGMTNWKYYAPIFTNIILLIAIVLSFVWKHNRFCAVVLLVGIIAPGCLFQYHVLTHARWDGLWQHGQCFYEPKRLFEHVKKPFKTQQRMCETFPDVFCCTVGRWYGRNDAFLNPVFFGKRFQLLGNNEQKRQYLYEGYFSEKYVQEHGDCTRLMTYINALDDGMHAACYRGIGQGVVLSFYDEARGGDSFYDVDEAHLMRSAKKIVSIANQIPSNMKDSFFYGIGNEFARQFAIAYAPRSLIGAFLDMYMQHVADMNSQAAFLAGFYDTKIWTEY